MRWGLHPAAFTPWGGMGPGTKHLLYEVSKRALSDIPSHSKDFRSLEIYQIISITLAREVASQLAVRCRILDDLSE